VAGVIALSAGALTAIAVFASGNHHAPSRQPRPRKPDGASAGAGGPPCQPVGWAQSPAVADALAGLLLDGASAGDGSALDRCDRTAVDGHGPW